jgi:hypothetical protein
MGFFFIAIGLLFFSIWYYLKRKVKASAGWLPAPGRVLSCSVSRYRDSDNDPVEEIAIAYQYSVGGAVLQGNRVGFGKSGTGGVKATVARYPAGKDVMVFYDPQKPAAAVLERNIAGSNIVLPMMGVIFLVVGLIMR